MAGLKGLDHWSLRGGWGEEDVPLTLYAHVYIDEQKLHAPHQEIFDIFLDECQWDE